MALAQIRRFGDKNSWWGVPLLGVLACFVMARTGDKPWSAGSWSAYVTVFWVLSTLTLSEIRKIRPFGKISEASKVCSDHHGLLADIVDGLSGNVQHPRPEYTRAVRASLTHARNVAYGNTYRPGDAIAQLYNGAISTVVAVSSGNLDELLGPAYFEYLAHHSKWVRTKGDPISGSPHRVYCYAQSDYRDLAAEFQSLKRTCEALDLHVEFAIWDVAKLQRMAGTMQDSNTPPDAKRRIGTSQELLRSLEPALAIARRRQGEEDSKYADRTLRLLTIEGGEWRPDFLIADNRACIIMQDEHGDSYHCWTEDVEDKNNLRNLFDLIVRALDCGALQKALI